MFILHILVFIFCRVYLNCQKKIIQIEGNLSSLFCLIYIALCYERANLRYKV